jgi:hypothetical protein
MTHSSIPSIWAWQAKAEVFTVDVGLCRPVRAASRCLPPCWRNRRWPLFGAVKGRLGAYSERHRRGIVPSMRAARKTGYAISDGLVLPNVRAAAVALHDPRGIAIGSLGVAAIDAYATQERLTEFAGLLKCTQAYIERALRQLMAP